MIPSGRLNGYSVNTIRDVLVSSADADSTGTSGETLLRCSDKLARRGFPLFFFNRSYIFALTLLDIHRLNNPTDPLDSYGVVE